MHSEMPAEPAQAYVFAEKRKSLRYVGVFGCALEPPAIHHGHQAVERATSRRHWIWRRLRPVLWHVR
jgi:hypothetical protein